MEEGTLIYYAAHDWLKKVNLRVAAQLSKLDECVGLCYNNITIPVVNYNAP
jgi:hypothetical protein